MNKTSLTAALSRQPLTAVAAGAGASAIFAADIFTPPDVVVSGLYVLVILAAGRILSGRVLWLVCLFCIGLAILAQFLAHRYVLESPIVAYIGAFNTAVSAVIMALATYFVAQSQAAQTKIQLARADLARASRVTTLGELTASIAHEVNQPIAGIVTNANACTRWLAAEPPNLDMARASVERIVRDGTRAADIIARIRAVFAKGGTQRQGVDLNRLVSETAELLASEAARNAIGIQTDLDAGLLHVTGDRVQLQQVLVNLMLNGLDAMRNAESPRALILRTRQSAPGRMTVSVIDCGVGLPSAEQGRLFDAFFTTKPHGTGMGLSISRSIIEAHEGRLWAEANPPGGAVFSFELPAVSADTKV